MRYRVAAADVFSTEREHLWDLCYRTTGSAADADVLLRDSFTKAMEHPLTDRAADWRPYLTRSAAIPAMDALRQRKRRNYIGCWMPSPCETGAGASPAPRPPTGLPGARYDIVESGSIAFLLALEKLDPRERVMLLMCDAFGIEPYEAATALELAPPTGKAALHQARRKMQPYDAGHEAPTAEVQAQTADVLRPFLLHLENHDAGRLEKMLAPGAQLCFDGAGEFVAPHAPLRGSARIARVLLKFADGTNPLRLAFRMLNGMPAALGVSPGHPRWPRHFVFRIETRDGLVTDVETIMASAKLTAVRFEPA
jgi:DNA-directed RNA polymerase specialized sigma24 family protein